MSPFEIRMLIHFYTTPSRYNGLEYDNRAWDRAIRDFQSQGLIKPMATTAEEIELTDKGEVYVEMLTLLPLPKKQCMWVDDHGKVIRETKED